jgi:hypothetical protein
MVFTSRNWFVMQEPVAIILISWNVIFIWETGYWTRAMNRFALFDLLKSLYSDTKSCRNIFSLYRDNGEWWIFIKWKCIKVRKSTKCQGYFLSMCDVKVFLTFIFVVEILQGTRGCWWRWFTIDVPPSSLNLVLRWLLFYLFCSNIVINAVIVTAGTFEP